MGDSLKLREGLLRCRGGSKRNRRDCVTVGDKGESMRGFERDVCMCDDDPSET